MYNVTLINLSPDARTAAVALVPVERTGIPETEMQVLLGNFCDLDPLESAACDPEIRVYASHGSYLIRHGQKKLILYDVRRRDLAAQQLTVEEAMAELNHSAESARIAAQAERRQAGATAPAFDMQEPVRAEPPRRSWLVVLATVAVILFGSLAWLWWPEAGDVRPRPERVEAAELAPLLESLAGVYLTGSKPGSHGIALTVDGGMKIFELRAVDAPGVINADWKGVREDGRLCLATDQPGGLIEVHDRNTLLYCGETYRRIP